MATAETITSLRYMIAEVIPETGTEADTLFTDARLGEILDAANQQLEAASYEAWREKAGMLANLVDVADGAASRKLSQLYDNALGMVRVYSKASAGPTEGRTRIGKVVKPS